MANPIISKASVTTTCYRTTNISEKQQKAYKVYAKTLQLKAMGGTDYTTNLPALLAAAASLCCGMEQPDREAARVKLEFDQATAAGASIPIGINNIQAQANCLIEVDPKALDEADLLLQLALGTHKSYPQ